MAVKFITFCDENMTKAAYFLCESAIKHGVPDYAVYGPGGMNPTWKAIQRDVLANSTRGVGCWCWKPAIVLDAMLNLEVNDVLIYCDAGCLIISDLKTPIGY